MRLFIFIILFFSILFVNAQAYTYAHYDIKDGVAGSTVYCSVQDKDNFMWFGTETGLSRFDGSNFTNFGSKEGLPDNEVLKLFCDSQNRIWCSLFKNDICYILNGKVYNKFNDSMIKKIPLDGIAWQICEDKKGNIMIREDRALHIISTTNELKSINSIASNNHPIFSSISQSSNGNFLVCESNKIYELNSDGKTTLVKVLPRNQNLMRNTRVNKDLIYWSSSIYRYNVFSFKKNSDKSFTVPADIINMQFLNDSLICLNKVDGCVIINFYTNTITDNILPSEPISSVSFDYEGGLWFTTLGHGIFRLSSTAFRTYNFTRENKSSLSVFSIVKYKKYILAGADGNYVFKINSSNLQNFERYRIHYTKEIKNRIISIQTLDSTFFLGTDLALFKTTNFKHDKILDYYNVKKLLLFNKDSLLVAGKNSLAIINTNSLKSLDTILNERVVSFNVVGNNLFAATLSGLHEINLKTKRHIKLNLPMQNARITVLEKDLNGALWIGTNGSGILAYKDGKFFYELTETKGLTSNVCRCISVYNNTVWIGTDKGINKIILHPSPHLVNKFSSTDGLPSNIINAILQDSVYVYIASAEGLTYFNSNTIIANSKCVLRIINIVSGIDTLNNEDIYLSSKKRELKFNYVGISFSSAGNIKYHYRLKGLQNEWQETSNTSINYPSLPPGNYSFEVKAVNKYGVESKTIVIPVNIEKKLSEKTWFHVLIFLLTAFIIWLIMKGQIKRIKIKEVERNNIRRQIADLKQKALKSQISPHFIFNSLNSVQAYMLNNDIEGSNRFISRFSELIRKTLNLSEKQEISIEEELSYLNLFLLLEQERFEYKFQFKIFSQSSELENYHIPPLLLQPLVENAVKHGVRARNDNKGIIEISADIFASKILLIVKDNGPGIYYTQTSVNNKFSDHVSMGMLLVQERIKALNGINSKKSSIVVKELDENSYYRGTIIQIEIPLV